MVAFPPKNNSLIANALLGRAALSPLPALTPSVPAPRVAEAEDAEALKARIGRIYTDYLRAPHPAKAIIINDASRKLFDMTGEVMDGGSWRKVR